jgi:hypothetical protein
LRAVDLRAAFLRAGFRFAALFFGNLVHLPPSVR